VIRLRLSGAVDLRRDDGAEIGSVLAQPKRTALLVFFAASAGAGQRRATLLALLWPELDEAHARNALRSAATRALADRIRTASSATTPPARAPTLPSAAGELPVPGDGPEADVPRDRFATASGFAEAPKRGPGPMASPAPTARRMRPRTLSIAATDLLFGLAAGWRALARPDPPSPRIDSIAVLPLANLTGDPGQQHFVDAMHDGLIAELAQIRGLRVISRQSVLRYRGTDRAAPDIARELNVAGLVEGSVFRAGDTVRITLQLLQARPTERHLWAAETGRPAAASPRRLCLHSWLESSTTHTS
jgi:TolB-like protein